MTVPPQPSQAGSGPISAPAPSTTRVRPARSSQSGLATTSRTAAAQDGSMIPADTQASSRRSSASPRSS
ncbi:hypothetical protein AB0M54_41285 [Actinoplanes sp. NPDC051470]|uniref:hypothetical protein n=1 Tax=Actinoplanes sp. NPDC051470 TaxID=3157224 RepID=UPI003449BDE7